MKKTAFVTGASRGIGRAIARTLALDGYAVGINYLKEKEKADALADELRALGCEAMAVQADVSDAEAVTATIRRWRRRFLRSNFWSIMPEYPSRISFSILMPPSGGGCLQSMWTARITPFRQCCPG